eukprot:gnl/TRDRNA2_/TRDRNA2_175795_c0_seq1.p1 gnl/TRDRNA2_/TRDRNA2_175795_c0~~gnl/TRDRNA2_/TRDRNA2_175795_c0_seq1.p1  ORF type:complete len:368 (-),score=126.89 gnl/TRDRNA2_/TRDRNA2_175795_c0_seq1:78-1181(-)
MRSLLIGVLVLALTSAAALKTNGEAPGPAPGPAPLNAGDMCRELCKKDTGMDADFNDCMTECNVYTDTAPSWEDAGGEFTEDESYNEKGGEEMEDKFEEMFPEKKVADCYPQVDVNKEPSFEDVDLNHDGKVTKQEAIEWGAKACIPDEMVRQLFHDTDGNRDQYIDKAEWGVGGEDTALEKKIDERADPKTEGDDEYHEVYMPKFDVFDLNDDGVLEESEVFDAFMFEMRQRMPEMGPDDKQKLVNEFRGKFSEDFKALDKNSDGVLDEEEYYAKTEGDLGTELKEQANQDEDLEDPDDMGRDDALPLGPAPGPAPASLMSKRLRTVTAHKPKEVSKLAAAATPSPILAKLWQDAVTVMGLVGDDQ